MKKIFRIEQQYIAYISIILLFTNLFFCQSSKDYESLYNLHFQMSDSVHFKKWSVSIPFSGSIKTDCTEQRGGKYPLVIKNEIFQPFGRLSPIKIRLSQQLLLPSLLSDSAEVSITYKILNIKQINLIVSGLNKYENLLCSDTLCLKGKKEWTNQLMRVPLKDIVFWRLSVLVQGIDSACEQQCWLDRITIKVDGKDIESLPSLSCTENIALSEKDLVPLSFPDPNLYSEIPELKTKPIFALGETVHGSDSFAESALQLIKHQVQYNNCKLILLELPVEQGLSLNRYIQGDESFEIDSLVVMMKHSFNAIKYKDLLLWLKEYNRQTQEKVWLMGMDIEIYHENSMTSLFDYLYTMNQTKQQPIIDTLCHQVIGFNSDFTSIASAVSKNAKLQSVLGEKEHSILVHCLNISGKATNSTNRRVDLRDSIMFENAHFLIQLLCNKDEKTIIYAHLGHVNYKSFIPFSNSYDASFGQLMKQVYGKDYFVTGLFTGGGSFSTSWTEGVGIIKSIPLSPSPGNSFEYLLDKIDKDYYYLSILPECPVMIRLIGNTYRENAFEAVSLCSRMDAAVYIRKSQPVVLFPGISAGKEQDIMTKYQKALEKDRLKFPLKSIH